VGRLTQEPHPAPARRKGANGYPTFGHRERLALGRMWYRLRYETPTKIRYFGRATFQKMRSCLFAIFERAVRDGLVVSNPVRSVRLEHESQKEKKVRSLDEAQVRAFFVAAKGTPFESYFHLALATGARPSELLALEWSDIDFELGTVRISASLGQVEWGGPLVRKATKTARSRRLLDVPLSSLERLRSDWEAQGSPRNGYLFTNSAGSAWDYRGFARRALAPIASEAKLKIVLYDFRHTSNSLLLASGVSPVVLAERLGHSSTRLVESTYATVLRGMQKQASDKVGDIFARVL